MAAAVADLPSPCPASISTQTSLFLRLADRHKSPIPSARRWPPRWAPGTSSASYGLWRWDSSYLFYTGRLMPQIPSEEEMNAYLAQDRKVFLLVEDSDMDKFLADLKSPPGSWSGGHWPQDHGAPDEREGDSCALPPKRGAAARRPPDRPGVHPHSCGSPIRLEGLREGRGAAGEQGEPWSIE